MLKLFLWLRYLRKKKIVFLSITAVALSAALLIVVASLFTGFINAFEQSAVEALGDIVLAPPVKFSKYQLFIERLEQVRQVKAATATLSGQGLLHLGKGNVRAVKLSGIEPKSRAKVTGLKQFLHKQKDLPREPSFEVPGLPGKLGGFVGIGVVAEPDEKTDEYDFAEIEKMVGQQVVLTTGAVPTARENKSTRGQFKRKTVKLAIADIVFTGVYDLDKSYVYLPIERLQRILYPNQDGQVADQIQIKLTGDTEADVAMAQIRGLWHAFATEQLGWGPYLINETTIITAKEMQSPLVAAFRKQLGILLLIFGVVSFTVVLLILCIFYMIVMTRQKDIAIIKSCGATGSSVALIFVGFGAFVGIIGSGMGAIIGYIVTKNINTIEEWIRIIFGLKLWKSSVYMFSKIPNEIDWDSALPIILSAVIAASLGALIPAIIAVRTRPVNILRYE
jgi:lipoprotein-releasing system permease protein